MRRPLVAGNWKMHGSKESVAALLKGLARGCERVEVAELAVLVPSVFLAATEAALMRSQIVWGAQNVSQEANGAFTGELSVSMLREFGCAYTLVGHSERRTLYDETNEIVAKKCAAAWAGGLAPIVCVGETASEREAGQTLRVIEEQLDAVLRLADNQSGLPGTVVAYEPVWAIGTGNQPLPEQVQDVHGFIRERLGRARPDFAKWRVLYGGSVKPSNAGALFALPDVDGGLIGGASLDPDTFIEIGRLCKR